MTLYTLESPRSAERVAGKIVVADSSYLISFTRSDTHSASVDAFHKAALKRGAHFFINVIVRHEFMQKVRLGSLALAMQSLANGDAAVASRYAGVRNLYVRPGHTRD